MSPEEHKHQQYLRRIAEQEKERRDIQMVAITFALILFIGWLAMLILAGATQR